MNRKSTKHDENPPLVYYSFLESTPLGKVLVGTSENGLCFITFGKLTKQRMIQKLKNTFPDSEVTESSIKLSIYKKTLGKYFKGDLKKFELPLDLRGIHSSFQQKVYRAALKIPYGKVITYRELAQKIKVPGAPRAVGNALGRNRIPIVIPCHRVVAANGGLGGFTGGIEYKKILLRIEDCRLKDLKTVNNVQ